MLNGLDLFSGIGGMSYALREYVRPLAYCEIDSYCQALLLDKMHKSYLFAAPIWDDIKSFDGFTFRDSVDIIYGGFPCQDISVAGHGKGLGGERSNLYWEVRRLAKEIRPKFIFLENVPAITSRGGCEVVDSLAEIGYDSRWCTLSAQGCGAPHKRERWWLLAHSQHNGYSTSSIRRSSEEGVSNPQKGKNNSFESKGMDYPGDVAESSSTSPLIQQNPHYLQSYWEETEPPLCGVDDGISFRVDRIRGLGNSVVPDCAKKAFKHLMGIEVL